MNCARWLQTHPLTMIFATIGIVAIGNLLTQMTAVRTGSVTASIFLVADPLASCAEPRPIEAVKGDVPGVMSLGRGSDGWCIGPPLLPEPSRWRFPREGEVGTHILRFSPRGAAFGERNLPPESH